MPKYIDLKESVSKNVNNFYDGWEEIVHGFKNGILPLSKTDDMKIDSADQQLDILDTTEQRRFNNFSSQIKEEQKNIDMKSFKKYFSTENLMKWYKICLIQKVSLIIMTNWF